MFQELTLTTHNKEQIQNKASNHVEENHYSK